MTNKTTKLKALWYKLKRIFLNIFRRNEILFELVDQQYLEASRDAIITTESSIKEKEQNIQELTKRVLKKEIDFEILSKEEVESISLNIQNEIDKMNKEIETTRINISKMKEKIKENQ